jgi:hypothetical protein
MRVKELIEALQDHDPKTLVVMDVENTCRFVTGVVGEPEDPDDPERWVYLRD